MNKKIKLTVSVGIPVNNEANTIVPLLKSILNQSKKNYSLEKVYVICDAPTDNTDKIAADFALKRPNISVIYDGKRMGKLKRVEQFFKLGESDILITFDGDLILKNNRVIDNLLKKFTSEKIGIVGGNAEPVRNDALVGYALFNWVRLWYYARRDFNRGNNIHNIRGCILAIRNSLAKKITFPKNYASESQFLYFSALKSKYDFRYADDAIVIHNIPATINDYLSQKFRPQDQKKLLLQKFGTGINSFYEIPFQFKLKAVLESFLSDPVGLFVAICFQLYISFKYKNIKPQINNGIWNSVTSTKKVFSV